MRKIRNKKRNKRKGFTLIELIVVIAILAVLVVGAVVAYGNLSDEANKTALRSDASAVVRAVNTHNALANTAIATNADLAAKYANGVLNLDLHKETVGGNPPNSSVNLEIRVTIDQDRWDILLDATNPWVTVTGGTASVTEPSGS